jgi:hypothetical protein
MGVSMKPGGGVRREPIAMSAHKFKVGQSVSFATGMLHQKRPLGRFQVTRTLPSERGVNQYRIKSQMDGHERVVQETEIA